MSTAATLDAPDTTAVPATAPACECDARHHRGQPCPHTAGWLVNIKHADSVPCSRTKIVAVCTGCKDELVDGARQFLPGMCSACRTVVRVVSDLITFVPLNP